MCRQCFTNNDRSTFMDGGFNILVAIGLKDFYRYKSIVMLHITGIELNVFNSGIVVHGYGNYVDSFCYGL